MEVSDDPKKPDGLELSRLGQLTGTPTKDDNFGFTVRVTDSVGQMMEKSFDLTIKKATAASVLSLAPVTISPPLPLPDASAAVAYRQMLVTTESLTIKDTLAASASAARMTDQEETARAVLRQVRRSINEFRNQSWSGLILARNHLLEAMIYTGLTVFVLLSIAIFWEANQNTVLVASVFYLVGATAGLGDRLRRESQSEAAIYDYGLWAARLVTIPLFSGLAAVGGVLLMAMSNPTDGPPTLDNILGLT